MAEYESDDNTFESMDGDDVFDADFAADLVGCTLLVGLTHVDHMDQLIRHQQIFGTVATVAEDTGIVIRQHHDGTSFTIAPVLDAIEVGAPGIYQMTEGDEEVEDPDFIALITVRTPAHN